MDILTIILEQIGLFVIYIIVGVLLVKAKVFNATTLETLSRFVLKLGLPVMIFINTVSGVDRAALIRSLPVMGLAVVLSFVLTLLLGFEDIPVEDEAEKARALQTAPVQNNAAEA